MRHEGVVRVRWTRAEVTAIREAIEVTPNFEGRLDVRDILRDALRSPRLTEVVFEAGLAERLSGRLVPIDAPTAMARAKLLLAVRGPKKRSVTAHGRPRRPLLVSADLLAPPTGAPSVAATAAA